jgi:MarR family transcriptional regulator, organic hydroperoxide resistance regulator
MMKPQPMPLDQFVGRLTQILPRLVREVWQFDRTHVAAGDFSLSQIWALEYLLEHPSCTMCEMASVLRLNGSTATGQMDRLVRRSFVRRSRSRDDRRVVLVSLTARGRRMMQQIRDRKRQALTRWFGQITEADRMRYLTIVEKLHTGILSETDSLAAERSALT